MEHSLDSRFFVYLALIALIWIFSGIMVIFAIRDIIFTMLGFIAVVLGMFLVLASIASFIKLTREKKVREND